MLKFLARLCTFWYEVCIFTFYKGKREVIPFFLIVGEDNAGKTTTGALLSLLSLGKIGFSDSSELYKALPILQEVKDSVYYASLGRKTEIFDAYCREYLKTFYKAYAKDLILYAVKQEDMYIGMRDIAMFNFLKEELRQQGRQLVVLRITNSSDCKKPMFLDKHLKDEHYVVVLNSFRWLPLMINLKDIIKMFLR